MTCPRRLLTGGALLVCLYTGAPARAETGASHGCYATVAQAAQSVVGTGASAGRQGYRAEALVIDPVLHRAWLRVAECAHPEHPSALVSLEVGIADAVPASQSFSIPKQALPALPLIPSGQAVEVAYKRDAVQMSLHGRTVAAAHIGESVEVLLDGSTGVDDTPRHMHGRLVAADRVEVHA